MICYMLQVCTCGKICTNQNLLCLTMGKPENRSFLGWFKWLVSLLQQRKVILRLYIVHGYTPFSDIHMVWHGSCHVQLQSSFEPATVLGASCDRWTGHGSNDAADGRSLAGSDVTFFSQPPDDPVSVRVIPVLPHAKSQYKLVLVDYQHGLTTYSNFKPFLDTKTPAPKVQWITNSVKDWRSRTTFCVEMSKKPTLLWREAHQLQLQLQLQETTTTTRT